MININFILNGGINNLEYAYNLTKEFDGVMLGRLIQNNPFCLRKIDSIFSGYLSKGIYELKWDAQSFASGIYFVSFQSDKYSYTQKITLIK